MSTMQPLQWWEDIFSGFEEQMPAAWRSRRKLSWLQLLKGIGMPHSMADSFIQDVTGDDDFEAKLRENIQQDEADRLLAKVFVVQ